MRHRVKKRHLGRDTNHRKALLRNLVRDLVKHGELKTTKTKAKEVARLTDKLVIKAKQNTVAARRLLHSFFGKRDVVNTLVEKIVPAASKRQSGFTSIKSLGKRRGDNSEMVTVKFVDEIKDSGTLKAPQPKALAKKAVTAKKVKKTVKKQSKTEVKKS